MEFDAVFASRDAVHLGIVCADCSASVTPLSLPRFNRARTRKLQLYREDWPQNDT